MLGREGGREGGRNYDVYIEEKSLVLVLDALLVDYLLAVCTGLRWRERLRVYHEQRGGEKEFKSSNQSINEFSKKEDPIEMVGPLFFARSPVFVLILLFLSFPFLPQHRDVNTQVLNKGEGEEIRRKRRMISSHLVPVFKCVPVIQQALLLYSLLSSYFSPLFPLLHVLLSPLSLPLSLSSPLISFNCILIPSLFHPWPTTAPLNKKKQSLPNDLLHHPISQAIRQAPVGTAPAGTKRREEGSEGVREGGREGGSVFQLLHHPVSHAIREQVRIHSNQTSWYEADLRDRVPRPRAGLKEGVKNGSSGHTSRSCQLQELFLFGLLCGGVHVGVGGGGGGGREGGRGGGAGDFVVDGRGDDAGLDDAKGREGGREGGRQ